MSSNFIEKCKVLGLTEKQAQNILGRVSKPFAPTAKKPGKIDSPKVVAPAPKKMQPSEGQSVDELSKTAFEYGIRDAITYLLEN